MELLIPVLFGLIAGLLVNYLSDVLPVQRKLTVPACASCGADYSWKDYFLFGACRACAKKRSLRTYLTLVASLAFSVALWLNPPARLGYWIGFILLAYFGLVVIIDIEHRLIMHVVSLAGALLGLLVGSLKYNLMVSLEGGLAGLVIMLIFYWVGILFARYRARKLGVDDGEEALGFGDVTISAVIGLMLGFPLVMYGLFLGVLAGGLFSLGLVAFLMLTRRYESMTVFTAYGPYLVLGAAILLYFTQILSIMLGK